MAKLIKVRVVNSYDSPEKEALEIILNFEKIIWVGRVNAYIGNINHYKEKATAQEVWIDTGNVPVVLFVLNEDCEKLYSSHGVSIK